MNPSFWVYFGLNSADLQGDTSAWKPVSVPVADWSAGEDIKEIGEKAIQLV